MVAHRPGTSKESRQLELRHTILVRSEQLSRPDMRWYRKEVHGVRGEQGDDWT